MFEYMDAEKKGLDAYTVMARAIRAHYHDNEESINPSVARICAQIIDDGFLDGTIAEQKRLIEHMQRILKRTEDDVKEEERKMRGVLIKTEQLKDACFALEKRIEIMKKLEQQETDQFLLGAKKAYYFIMGETGDEEKASKAFNSYLQGVGKWKQYQDHLKSEDDIINETINRR